MSSLSLALNSAVSSLLTLQSRMGLVSSNIANANTPGYTAQSATVTANVTNGIGSGVNIGTVTHNVDKILVQQIAASSSQLGYATTTNNYYQSLIQSMGTVSQGGGGTDLSNSMNSLQTALNNLANSPESAALQGQAVSQIDDTTSLLRQTSAQVQQLRGNADQQISQTVSDVNNALNTIAQTNLAIARASAANQPTSALEDQRQTALQTLTSDMGVNYFINGNNQMIVIAGGQNLVDAAGDVNQLSHTAAGSVSALNTYTSGTYTGSHFDGIWVAGVDITPQIGNGSLKALIDQRDTTLPAVQNQLDAFATTLSTSLNQISNLASPRPVPTSLTGTQSLSGTTAVAVTGAPTIRIGQVDSTGNLLSAAVPVDLSACTNVSSVVSTINAAVGYSCASISSSGNLVLQGNGTNSIAVSTVSGSKVQLAGGTATDFSSAFGLNDLVVGGTSAATIAINSQVQSNPALIDGYSLNDLTGAAGTSAFASPLTSVGGQLANAVIANQTFTPSGGSTTTTTFGTYASNIITGVATQAQVATARYNTQQATLQTLQNTFSSESGVNMDEETAKMTQLQNAYAASAKVISTVQSMFQSLIQAVS